MDSMLPVNNDLNMDQLLKSRLDTIAGTQSKLKEGRKLSDKEKAEYEKAARGFESMMVHSMYKGMKEAMLDDKEEEESESFGADTLGGYTDLMFSDMVSKSGKGIGIAEKIYEQLTGGDTLKPITVEMPEKKIISDHLPGPVSLPPEPKPQEIGGSFLDRVTGRIGNYSDIISRAAEKYDVPESLIKSIITAESAGKPQAVSGAGAKGLMQLMDGTARDLGVRNAFDPYENIMGGTRYIKMMLDKFDGNLPLAVAAYNAGPGNVDKYDGIPPFSETKNYVSKVLGYHRMFENESEAI